MNLPVPMTIAAIRAVRAATGLSQRQFAHVYGLSLRSVQNWEQGRRAPGEAAQVLLYLIARMPHEIAAALADPARWLP